MNLLSDQAHPMQALADVLTIRQELDSAAGRMLAYVGDANNVCRSLSIAAAMAGMKVRLACPPAYSFADADLDRIRAAGVDPLVTARRDEAVEGADVVYTDVWTSMGQEVESEARVRAFEGFGVDERLMARAAPGAIFLHCLPAHRGEEVAAAVVDGPQSRVWRQAANRMHAARGLLLFLLQERT
jgi:ornithine carbamoyltransferase